MNRNVITALGLGAALLLTLAVGRLVDARERKECGSCSGWAMMESRIREVGGWMDYGKIKNGMVAVAVSPSPRQSEIVQTAVREFHQIAQFSSSNGCTPCKEIERISKLKGTTWEIVPLQTGALYLLTSTKPKVVTQIHALYDKSTEEMKQRQAGIETTCTGHTTRQKARDQQEELVTNAEEGND